MGEACYSPRLRRFLRDLRDGRVSPPVDPVPRGEPAIAVHHGLAEVVDGRLTLTARGRREVQRG